MSFFFNDTATTEIYTLSLHDALPISPGEGEPASSMTATWRWRMCRSTWRSEEHTSELQSQSNLVCRLLLEKKNETASISPPRIIFILLCPHSMPDSPMPACK